MNKMNKLIIYYCLMVLLLIKTTQAGYVSPIFNGDGSLWTDRISSPIVVQEDSFLGLTNPNIGETPYGFKFDVIEGDVGFTLNLSCPIPMSFYYSNFRWEGTHMGPGNIIDNIVISGNGLVNIYEKQFPSGSYDYVGFFTVVPEPATIMLLLMGLGGVRICQKKNS